MPGVLHTACVRGELGATVRGVHHEACEQAASARQRVTGGAVPFHRVLIRTAGRPVACHSDLG